MNLKKVLVIGATVALAATALVGCSSTSTITEYDSSGKVVKVIETKDSVASEIRKDLQNKHVMILKTGWVAKIQGTPADAEQVGAANFELSAGSVSGAWMSIHKDDPNAPDIAKSMTDCVAKVLNTSLSATTSGVSGSTGTGQNTSSATTDNTKTTP
ncbi:hypothetical protein SDC9_194239 [bioreactor metagenome]|uniref:Lipoprotein n=1 Tax=bioreactor metagenome TaxID=1076179 RepID=A0A645I5W9_9ZZZZ